MIKRLLLISFIAALSATAFSEGVKLGKQTMTVVDSFSAADTVGTAVRLDLDTSGVIDITKLDGFSFVFVTAHDTSFVNDTVGYVLLYSIENTDDANLWILFDTMLFATGSDITYESQAHLLDTLPPMNYLKFILYHRDSLGASANNVGLLGNVYNYIGEAYIKGSK